LLGSSAAPDFLVLPKTETVGHLRILERLLIAAGKDTRLIGLIETTHGLPATASPRLVGLMFGAADMAADLSAEPSWAALSGPRGRVVAACALAGVLAIDAPFFNIHDEGGLKQETAAAVALGFRTKAAIHPAQIGAINAALTPTAGGVEESRSILAENAKGVGTIDGQLVDEAIAQGTPRPCRGRTRCLSETCVLRRQPRSRRLCNGNRPACLQGRRRTPLSRNLWPLLRRLRTR
jgi:(S)-citramalyl-CoA lyase